MSGADIAYLLRDIPLFADLRGREVVLLGMVMKERSTAPGEVLFREGETGDCCYLVLSGSVEVSRRGLRLARLGPHEMFGQIALVSSCRRTATCTALEPTHLLRLDRSDFDSLFRSGSHFAFRFQAVIARVAAEQLREAIRELSAVLKSEPEEVTEPRRTLRGVEAIIVRSDRTHAGHPNGSG